MLWLGAFMALATCGGGESLTFEESVDLIKRAAARTWAGELSFDDTGIDVVEMDNSTGEYIFNIFSMYYEPGRGWFGYKETFNRFRLLVGYANGSMPEWNQSSQASF